MPRINILELKKALAESIGKTITNYDLDYKCGFFSAELKITLILDHGKYKLKLKSTW